MHNTFPVQLDDNEILIQDKNLMFFFLHILDWALAACEPLGGGSLCSLKTVNIKIGD